jgi:hypothetical protein
LGRPLRREDGSVVCNYYWPSPAQSFSSPSPIGLVSIFYCLRFESTLFVASYDSQGHGGAIRPRLHTGKPDISSQSYIATDSQSASLSWNKAPIWGLRPDLCYCQTVADMFMWGALSEERTCVSFKTAAGPHQPSRVRVPWDSDNILLSQIRDFPFRRLIRLAGLRWRFSIPPPHG